MSDINYNTATLEELQKENKRLNDEILKQRLIAENKRLQETLDLISKNHFGVRTLYDPFQFLTMEITTSGSNK